MREEEGRKKGRARDRGLGRSIGNEFNCNSKLFDLNMKCPRFQFCTTVKRKIP